MSESVVSHFSHLSPLLGAPPLPAWRCDRARAASPRPNRRTLFRSFQRVSARSCSSERSVVVVNLSRPGRERRILPSPPPPPAARDAAQRRSREDGQQLQTGGLCCGIELIRDVRFSPVFIMKPLAASDSNGVPSQQEKTPVSTLPTRFL